MVRNWIINYTYCMFFLGVISRNPGYKSLSSSDIRMLPWPTTLQLRNPQVKILQLPMSHTIAGVPTSWVNKKQLTWLIFPLDLDLYVGLDAKIIPPISLYFTYISSKSHIVPKTVLSNPAHRCRLCVFCKNHSRNLR